MISEGNYILTRQLDVYNQTTPPTVLVQNEHYVYTPYCAIQKVKKGQTIAFLQTSSILKRSMKYSYQHCYILHTRGYFTIA